MKNKRPKEERKPFPLWRAALVFVALGFIPTLVRIVADAWATGKRRGDLDIGDLRLGDPWAILAGYIGAFAIMLPAYLLLRVFGHARSVKAIVILFVIFAGVPMSFYMSGIRSPQKSDPLRDAVIYNGPMPEPLFIQVDDAGQTMIVYPNQINLFTKPGTNVRAIEDLVASMHGEVLTKIPAFGFYLLELEFGKELKEATKKMEENEFVLGAVPNFVVFPAGDAATGTVVLGKDVVDLSDAGKSMEELRGVFYKKPDPETKIVSVQIDSFKGKHGESVQAAREAAGAAGPVLKVNVGGLKCGGPDPGLCSSSDRVFSALAAVFAAADRFTQKVIINIPLSILPLTTNEKQFSKSNGEGSNAWATRQWQADLAGMFSLVKASDAAKKGNVSIHRAAGNGACLLGKNSAPVDCTGTDLGRLLEQLFEETGLDPKTADVRLYGVQEKGKPAKTSNHGKDVIMNELPEAEMGTSLSSSRGWAESEQVWKEHSDVGAVEMRKLLLAPACPAGLQACGKSCIPTNADCCNGNMYCLKPTGSCAIRKLGTCSTCPVGQKFCGMFCISVAKTCQIGTKARNQISCNGRNWNDTCTPLGLKLYCPPEEGDATCVPVDNVLCQGEWYPPCGIGTAFVCDEKGGHCNPVKGKTKGTAPRATAPATKPAPGGAAGSKEIVCNGKTWQDTCTPQGMKLYCPPEGGDPGCVPEGYQLCGGKWYEPCPSGTRWVCGSSGASCDPVAQPAPSPAPMPSQPSPPATENCEEKIRLCKNQCWQTSNACYASCLNAYQPCNDACIWGPASSECQSCKNSGYESQYDSCTSACDAKDASCKAGCTCG